MRIENFDMYQVDPEHNIDQLNRLSSWLVNHPLMVDQDTWGLIYPDACGTTACAAGWTLILNDVEIVWETRKGWRNRKVMNGINESPFYGMADKAIPIKAAEILGLDAYEASALFHEAWDLDEAIGTISRIIAGDYREPAVAGITKENNEDQ